MKVLLIHRDDVGIEAAVLVNDDQADAAFKELQAARDSNGLDEHSINMVTPDPLHLAVAYLNPS